MNVRKILSKQNAALVLIAFMLVILVACGSAAQSPGSAAGGAAQDIGQGSVAFRFEVTDDTETVNVWNVHTDETTVGAALVEVDLISGDVSDFGLMVREVNGLVADFDANQAWWAFYIDGEMAMEGVDTTEIEPEKVYAFVYTIG